LNAWKKLKSNLIQVEKLNALGQLSASIAHEINNPLAGILVYNQLLQKMIKNTSLDPDKALDILSKWSQPPLILQTYP